MDRGIAEPKPDVERSEAFDLMVYAHGIKDMIMYCWMRAFEQYLMYGESEEARWYINKLTELALKERQNKEEIERRG